MAVAAVPVRKRLSADDVARARALSARARALPASPAPRPAPKSGIASRAVSAAALAVPGAGEAEIALALAGKGLEVVKSDIVVLHGQRLRKRTIKMRVQAGTTKRGRPRYREVEKDVYTPLDWELHINGVSLALAAIGAAVTAFITVVAWNGITTGGVYNRTAVKVIPGITDSPYWRSRIDRKSRAAHDQECANTYASFKAALETGDVNTARYLWDYNRYNREDYACSWTYLHRRP